MPSQLQMCEPVPFDVKNILAAPSIVSRCQHLLVRNRRSHNLRGQQHHETAGTCQCKHAFPTCLPSYPYSHKQKEMAHHPQKQEADSKNSPKTANENQKHKDIPLPFLAPRPTHKSGRQNRQQQLRPPLPPPPPPQKKAAISQFLDHLPAKARSPNYQRQSRPHKVRHAKGGRKGEGGGLMDLLGRESGRR